MTKDYQEFLQQKQQAVKESGFDISPDDINPKLFLFQRDIVRWALQLGKAALFEECGLGKTFQQLEWAKHVVSHTNGRVLVLAPLAVASQTIREGEKLGISVVYRQSGDEITENDTIIITNYERLHLFDDIEFSGIVLDESSILKNIMGKTRKAIIDRFSVTPYRLACTATPAPNDYQELGNHAEFLGYKSMVEMLATWFVNDASHTRDWRLKKHAAADFWRWLTSWAVCLSRPGDLGDQYERPDFDLPPLAIHEHLVDTAQETIERTFAEGRLIPDSNPSSTTLHKVKRESLDNRIEQARVIVNSIPDNEPILIWCDTDYEADALIREFPEADEVRGKHSITQKEEKLMAFTDGKTRILITKPDIAGFGLNWQHCAHLIFVGVSFSFEKTYQALRRSYRFGQEKTVNAHMIYALTEGNVLTRLNEKQAAFLEMQKEMNKAMNEHGLFRGDVDKRHTQTEFETNSGKDWQMILGDCVPVTATLPDNSIDFCIHSPPFADLFVYSDSEADMGNATSDDEFFDHYEYLIRDLYRATTPGRLCAVHCSDLPAMKYKHGYMGIRDFSGEIIRRFEKNGWKYHSRVTIWKNPVVEMQRTKAHALLHKSFKKNSEAVRAGLPDYLVVFRKWPEAQDETKPVVQNRVAGDYIGTEPPPETGSMAKPDSYSIEVWQRYASPVWFDIDQSNVLNHRIARDNQDEKHICPLQLDVIARSIDLWTNEGDTVFSPFAGVGSEGYEAIRMNRKFIGVELKRSYYDIAVKHLTEMERQKAQPTLFDLLPSDDPIELTGD